MCFVSGTLNCRADKLHSVVFGLPRNADLPCCHIDFYANAIRQLRLSYRSTNALGAAAACHIGNIEMDHVSLLRLIHILTMNLVMMRRSSSFAKINRASRSRAAIA